MSAIELIREAAQLFRDECGGPAPEAVRLEALADSMEAQSKAEPVAWAVYYFDTLTNTWEWDSIWSHKQFANDHLNALLAEADGDCEHLTQASVIPMAKLPFHVAISEPTPTSSTADRAWGASQDPVAVLFMHGETGRKVYIPIEEAFVESDGKMNAYPDGEGSYLLWKPISLPAAPSDCSCRHLVRTSDGKTVQCDMCGAIGDIINPQWEPRWRSPSSAPSDGGV